MNEITLDLAAEYVNHYRNGCERRGLTVDKVALRKYVSERFGAVYAAILIQ